MPLQPVQPTEKTLANQLAQRMVQDVAATAKRVGDYRSNGMPEVAEQEARTLPDGRVVPARPAQPAISKAALEEALGEKNCDVLDILKAVLEADDDDTLAAVKTALGL